jgi:formylglycine-generating enzyme required for sulfatase activity
VTSHHDIGKIWPSLHAVEQRDILLDLVSRAAQIRGEEPWQTLQAFTQSGAAGQTPGRIATAALAALVQPTAAPVPVQHRLSSAVGRQVRSLHTQVTSTVGQIQRAAAQRRAANRRQRIRRMRTPAVVLLSLLLWLTAWQAQQRWSRASAEWLLVQTEHANASVQADLKKKRQELATQQATLREVQHLRSVESQLAEVQTKAKNLVDQIRQRELRANQLESQFAIIEERLPELVSAGLAQAIKEYEQLVSDWQQLKARLEKVPTELRQKDAPGKMLAEVEANIQRPQAILAPHGVSMVDAQVTLDNLKPRRAQLLGMRQSLVDLRAEFEKSQRAVASVLQFSTMRTAFDVPTGDKNVFGHPVVTRQGSRVDVQTGLPLEIVHRATGIVFVWIPPGEFEMGARDGEVETTDDERPRHRVRISRGFWVSRYEITQGQYQQLMGNNPSDFSATGSRRFSVAHDTSRFPVERVSWHDCISFANKLSELDSPARQRYYRINNATVEVAGGDGYRLLTEAEWEYAARADTTTVFPWGDAYSLGKSNDGGIFYADKAQEVGWTERVGSYAANGWGLHDVVGNVREWVWDWYAANEYKRFVSQVAVDPQGPAQGVDRVLRGGGWFEGKRGGCRVANRDRGDPAHGFNYYGFRLALGSTDVQAQ